MGHRTECILFNRLQTLGQLRERLNERVSECLASNEFQFGTRGEIQAYLF